jgi:hypothetical protein
MWKKVRPGSIVQVLLQSGEDAVYEVVTVEGKNIWGAWVYTTEDMTKPNTVYSWNGTWDHILANYPRFTDTETTWYLRSTQFEAITLSSIQQVLGHITNHSLDIRAIVENNSGNIAMYEPDKSPDKSRYLCIESDREHSQRIFSLADLHDRGILHCEGMLNYVRK